MTTSQLRQLALGISDLEFRKRAFRALSVQQGKGLELREDLFEAKVRGERLDHLEFQQVEHQAMTDAFYDRLGECSGIGKLDFLVYSREYAKRQIIDTHEAKQREDEGGTKVINEYFSFTKKSSSQKISRETAGARLVRNSVFPRPKVRDQQKVIMLTADYQACVADVVLSIEDLVDKASKVLEANGNHLSVYADEGRESARSSRALQTTVQSLLTAMEISLVKLKSS